MVDRKRMREARIEIAKGAARRWSERSSPRGHSERLLKTRGPAAADTPEAVANYVRRRPEMHLKATARGDGDALRLERIIGTVDFTDRPGSEGERSAGRPVGRIVEIRGPGFAHEGFGTGFMIAPTLLMTNHHVFPSEAEARGCGVQFGFEFVGDALGVGHTFELDPATFFVNDGPLDFAIVAVTPTSLEKGSLADWGQHALIAETGKVLLGHPINIIQHPDGGPKRYASSNNEVIDRLDDFLHYRTDTRPGSSGSPGFNAAWEVVVLHHSGVPAMENGVILNDDGRPWSESEGDDAIRWIANEGVRVSRIVQHLRKVTLTDAREAALRDSIFVTAERDLEETQKQPLPLVPAVVSVPTIVTPGSPHGQLPLLNIQGGAIFSFGPLSLGASTALNGNGTRTEARRGRHADAVLEKKLRRDPNYGRRRGYDSQFLTGFEVSLPRIDDGRRRELVTDRFANPLVLDYHHFSLVMNKRWLLQMWSAVNVDYSPEVRWNLSRDEFGEDAWIHDPRISEELQIDDPELYAPAKKFDRGHVVRRDDSAWGATREEVEFANSDTFHWTNCTPQHQDFNRAAYGHRGIWGELENHIAEQADAVGNRLILFSGPVLDDARAIPHDFGGGKFRVPLDYWKVVVVVEAADGRRRPRLRSLGFLLEQEQAIDRFGLERLGPEERFAVGKFVPQQRSLADLAQRTGVVFPEIVAEADVLKGRDGDGGGEIEHLERIRM